MNGKIALAAVALAMLTTAANADSNFLLGGAWKLAEGDPMGCHNPISFTATKQSLSMNGENTITTPVTYITGPNYVFVVGNTGMEHANRYDLVAPNKINIHGGSCSWAR